MTTLRRTPLILVVDDDLTTNRMIQGILVRGGFRVAEAGTVTTALRKIETEPPDLVLLDIYLPDGNGLDLCRRLQANAGPVSAPVLFISSNDDISTKVLGFEAGGVDYITKPLAGAEVLARVSTHLRLKIANERLLELQSDQIQRLAGAQVTVMPSSKDFPEAGFSASLQQVLKAGGDFYDVIPIGAGVIDYVVADASGHNLAASFWTAALKALLGEYAGAASHPAEIVRSINGALCRMLPPGTFFTLIYGRLNRQTARLTVVNAAHPPALILRRQDHEIQVVWQNGDVLGSFGDANFETTELAVRAGDRFFLYSDGLIELNGSRLKAIEDLGNLCLAQVDASIESAVRSINRSMIAGVKPGDDLLLMGVDV